MVAYSYQEQFIDPTLSGRKRHTIRKNRSGRSRHARPGENLQHYVGMRTKKCRLFARSLCSEVTAIRLTFARKPDDDLVQIAGKPAITSAAQLDAFAQTDGFETWAALRTFWKVKHGNSAYFDGTIIYWKDLQPAL